MESLFKVRVRLARRYFSGEESTYNFSKDVAESFATKAANMADLSFDTRMSLEERIKWMEAI